MDPATAKIIAKVVISQVTDEEKRQRLIIGIIVGITVFVLIIATPMLLVTSTWDKIKEFFGWKNEDEMKASTEYVSIAEMKERAGIPLEIEELIYNGTLPMPVNNAVVTSEYGSRIHPKTGKPSYHTGIDLAGKWHSNIIAVYEGTVVFEGVQVGYGNCVEIEHRVGTEKFYTLYAHLATINVYEGQQIIQGNVIGTQGGDPEKDPNPRL